MVPTWTGRHTFQSATTWQDTGGGTDGKFFDAIASAGSLFLRLVNDTYAAATTFMQVLRSGVNITGLKFQGTCYTDLATLTDGANITWVVNSNFGQKAKVTLGGNRTMNAVTGAVEGATYFLWVVQDGTGTRLISWTTSGAGSFDFGAAGTPALTTTASKGDLLTFEAISIAGTLKLRFTGIAKGFG